MDVLRIAPTAGADNPRAQQQPQQQQPRAQPGIPGMPAQFFIPPNWQPFGPPLGAVPPPPPQQQPNPNQSNNNNINNNNNNINNNYNNVNNNNINGNQMGANAGPQVNRTATAGAVPPFIAFPPFLPYMAAPPMPTPPPDLSRLSLEELRALEGNERQHIEARLKHLRNVQTLVEAAVLQLQQYNQISNRWAPPPAAPSAETPSTSGQASNSSESTSNPIPSTSGSGDSVERQSDLPPSPQEMIRQRRLQRFSQTQEPVIDLKTGSVVTEASAQSSSQSSSSSNKANDSKDLNKNKNS